MRVRVVRVECVTSVLNHVSDLESARIVSESATFAVWSKVVLQSDALPQAPKRLDRVGVVRRKPCTSE